MHPSCVIKGGLQTRSHCELGTVGCVAQHQETLPVEGLRLREGDQPLPVKTDGPAIQDLVIADIEKRKALGLKRYGTLLKAGNGRDALQDAYEEALDLVMYLKQEIEERDARNAAANSTGSNGDAPVGNRV